MKRRDFLTASASGVAVAASSSVFSAGASAADQPASGKPKTNPASILIKNGLIVPMDGKSRTLKNQALLIQENRIAAIGDADALQKEHKVERVIDATGKVVMPGFVNGHVHTGETPNRGLAEDLTPVEYGEFALPLEEEILSEQDINVFAQVGSIEQLKFGNTCVMELGLASQEATAQAFHRTGIRGIIAPDVSDIMESTEAMTGNGKPDPALKKKRFAEARRLLEKWQHNDDTIVSVRLAHYMPVLASYETMMESKALAREYGVGLNAHAGFGEGEVFKQRFNKTQMQYLADIGYLDENTAIVHLLMMEEAELAPFRDSGAWMIHCPFEMAKRGGSAPMNMIYEAGLNVAIGSDWLMFDPFEQMRYAAVLARLDRGGIGPQKAYEFLEMMTIKGARAVGKGEEIGSLEVGKKADIILVDFAQAHLAPMNHHYDVVNSLVYNVHGSDVHTVIVDGRIVVEDREIITVDEASILAEANKRAEVALTKRFNMPDGERFRPNS